MQWPILGPNHVENQSMMNVCNFSWELDSGSKKSLLSKGMQPIRIGNTLHKSVIHIGTRRGFATVCRDSFGDRTDIEFLVAREPNLLKFAKSKEAVDDLLEQVGRMLPVKDAKGFVISNPGLVLDMESSNLPSAMDGDLTQPDDAWDTLFEIQQFTFHVYFLVILYCSHALQDKIWWQLI